MHRILLIIIALYFLSVQAEAQAWKKNSKFRLSETQIELGDSVELSWEVPKAKNVWLNEKSNVVPLTGSMMVSPDTTTYYALTIQKNNRKSFTKRRKVNVVKPEVVFFSLPDSATDEDRITVRWQAEHADYVMIDGISDTLRKVGSAKVSYDTTRLVSLTAYGKYNKAVVTDTINIQIIEDYGISQNTIYRGDTLSISWKTKFSDYVWFQGMDTTLSSVGKLTVKPEKDTVYNLYVARQSGIKELYASFPVKVRKPNIRYFWGESSILKGDWATLSWSVNGYDYVSIDNIGSNLPRKGARRVSPDETTTYVLRVKDGDQEIRMEKTLKVFPYRKYIAGTRHVEQVHENMPLMLDILSVDRSNYPDKITLRAVVVDTAGYYISGLAAQGNNSETGYRFFRQLSEISEAGRKTLPFEVREVQESASTPYDISLVLDYSGSMGGTIRYLEEAVYHFIRQKYINDKISITKFDDKIKTEAPLFMDADSILQRFKFTGLAGFGGHTALYAATDRGLAELDSSKRHKVVILFTDGNENASFQFFGDKAVTANQLAKQLRDQKARLIIISYGTGTNTEILYELAALADGKIYFVQSPDFIQQVFAEMPRVLHQYYEITFKPVEAEGDHRVFVYYQGNSRTGSAYFDYHIGNSFNLVEHDMAQDNYWYREINGKKPISAPQVAVNFVFNEDYLRDDYIRNLEKFLNYLKAYPDTELDILAHADHVGTEEQCKIVTERRSSSVKQFFIKKGIEPDRLHTRAMGKKYPIWPNEQEEWQAAENRRVELILYE